MTTGVTVWFTGLSGAGKTTIARHVEAMLLLRGVHVERLDGDVVRQSLTRDLGFSKEDRDANIERVTFVAKLLTRHGVVVLASFISPYTAQRERARREIGEFLEVYVDAPLEVLMQRDAKGLYQRALRGELQGFTGVNDPYDIPEQPDLVLDTASQTPEESARHVIALLESGGYVPAGTLPDDFARIPGAAAHARVPGPNAPHGGTLVDRELTGEARDRALAHARALPRVTLSARELSDLEMIGIGALSPLTGFMRRFDYQCVLDTMRLADGILWALPVTLTVSEAEAAAIPDGAEIALCSGAGEIVGTMRVTEKYAYDKQFEVERCFGTSDRAHPGVAAVLAQGDVCLGGPVWVLARPNRDEFPAERLTPLETRRAFDARGWRTVVAFQTRNPVHRAHEYLQKSAMEMVDGLLLHPLVGATKGDDVPPEVRMRTYRTILERYYPADRAMLAVYPAAMRYGGPREAVWHAICRKNYGCTHFIVGRDHAGVGNYYGTYEAQELIASLPAGELGITPLLFEHAFACRACGGMATAKTCPHDAEHHLHLSGSAVRTMLAAGERPPSEFTRPEVADLLIEAARGTGVVAPQGLAMSELTRVGA